MMEPFKAPTYDELVGLPNRQIVDDMKQLSNKINAARIRGESTSELSKIYQAYEEEWLKRLALSWYGYK